MYINHLCNLLISFSAFTAVAVKFFASSENVYTQDPCPEGYGTPVTTIIDICGGACQIKVTWCCAPGVSSLFPSMYIHEIEFLQDPSTCSCVGWAARPIPYPPLFLQFLCLN